MLGLVLGCLSFRGGLVDDCLGCVCYVDFGVLTCSVYVVALAFTYG